MDEPTQILSMHRTEPTRLQSLALQLAEKVASHVENNERIMEVKQGNFYFQKSSECQCFVVCGLLWRTVHLRTVVPFVSSLKTKLFVVVDVH